eukprot:scpid41130/ scgid33785/ 
MSQMQQLDWHFIECFVLAAFNVCSAACASPIRTLFTVQVFEQLHRKISFPLHLMVPYCMFQRKCSFILVQHCPVSQKSLYFTSSFRNASRLRQNHCFVYLERYCPKNSPTPLQRFPCTCKQD